VAIVTYNTEQCLKYPDHCLSVCKGIWDVKYAPSILIEPPADRSIPENSAVSVVGNLILHNNTLEVGR